MSLCIDRSVLLRVGLLLALALPCALRASAQPLSVPVARLDRVDAVVELQQVLRHTTAGQERLEPLPDVLRNAGDATFVEGRYRFDLDVPAGRSGWALYLSGAIGHVRIALNDQVLLDTITVPLAPGPRSINLLRLVDLPPHLLRDNGNRIEITLRSARVVSLSRIQVGSQLALREAREAKAMGLVYGPAVVAALIGSLGVSVLLIWVRRRNEPIYGYFGIASLAWGLHTAWTVSPREVIGGVHGEVAWTVLYAFLVAMLSIFCLRFVGHHWPRVERAIKAALIAVVPLLYAAPALGVQSEVDAAVRLGMVMGAMATFAVVARHAWRTRNLDSALLLLAGLAATGFGLRDWVVSETTNDYVPVYFTPYAGLPFVVLLAWILIDRFVRNTEALEGLNRELEQRVRAKSAELVSALDHMRAARDWADSANRAKSGFLAAASHDLRQPIHALGLYMSTLRGRPLDTMSQDIVKRMDGSVAALDSLFNALLDISRMDAGIVVPQARAIDLAGLLHRLTDEMAAEAAERGLRFSARIGAGPGPVTAWCDPLLLERVLRNLIANALKYTRSGGVLVTCRARRGPPRHWRVEVWDSGPGIPESERERVFDEFYQGGNPERDRRAGLGLGLAIVRRLTRLMKLSLALHSRQGHGTRFVLELPASDASVAASAAGVQADSLAGCIIAVVEDDLEVRDAMLTLLGSWGCRTLAGVDADEVLAQADERGLAAQAVVADLRLRGEHDGLQAVAALRARWGASLPALLVSGDSAPERVRLMQGSGLPWLAKPVPAARLRSWLASVLPPPNPEEATP